MRYLSSLSSEPRTSSRPIRRPAGRPIPALARSPPTLAPRFYPKQPACVWRVLTAATVSREAAQASPDPVSRLLVGMMALTLRTPAGSVEDPAPPGTARHIVPVSFGRAGVRSACTVPHTVPVSCREAHVGRCVLPGGQVCGAAQVSRAANEVPVGLRERPGALPGILTGLIRDQGGAGKRPCLSLDEPAALLTSLSGSPAGTPGGEPGA